MTVVTMTREELVRASNEAHEASKKLTPLPLNRKYVECLRELRLEARKESAVQRVWSRIVSVVSRVAVF